MTNSDESFIVADNYELISQGAEAKLWKIPAGSLFDVPCIAKERFSKAYRHPILDEKLTKQRCRAEARILMKCAEKGIAAPTVLRTHAPVLYIEYIDAPTVREYLENELLVALSEATTTTTSTCCSLQHEKLVQLASKFGQMVAELHNQGIVHGDLTTSNAMIRLPELQLIAIDFGLAKNTFSMEERAVDLYVLERALSSTHPKLPHDFWVHLLHSYKEVAEKADATLSRLEQVQIRGRKRECFG